MLKEKFKKITKKKALKTSKKILVLYNDNFNTFDFVIDTLIEVCGHEPEQAEQCTLVIHYKGKCAVKSGSLIELKPMHKEMINRKLISSIQ